MLSNSQQHGHLPATPLFLALDFGLLGRMPHWLAVANFCRQYKLVAMHEYGFGFVLDFFDFCSFSNLNFLVYVDSNAKIENSFSLPIER